MVCDETEVWSVRNQRPESGVLALRASIVAKVPGRPLRTLRRVNCQTTREPVDEWAQSLPVDSKGAACPRGVLASLRSIAVRMELNGVSGSMGRRRLTVWASAAANHKRSAAVKLSAVCAGLTVRERLRVK